ncbi:MAG: hypothetical protein A2987_01805 [Omnitrophica bacterium RIFCSPLOWO2_01_FULL_45_10]|nr:MAG: hypothetical protein A2987_01805 [Omnitrophica bacterium RIFCSPLOWO2_01_FULL_45_10]
MGDGMKYCRECVLPDTRPGIKIGAKGICTACLGHREKDEIDWALRKREFEEMVSEVKSRAKGYDCVVPVSGGKDSTAQVVKCLEYGLKVLAVTWKTPARTEIGQKNLINLINLGVDHIEFTINPEIERRFMYNALVLKGDASIPMHMALYAIPLRIATSYDIPLVLWGESPHMEYGGSQEERRRNSLDLEWFKTHRILHGTSVDEWVGDDLTAKDLDAYRLPDESEFRKKGIRSVFLGYYFKWDPEESLRTALKYGFAVRKEGPKTGYYNYADIDCDFISVHHYFKWLKFGFTRLFDNLSIEIRNGRITREEALTLIRQKGDDTPYEDIEKLCRFLRISLDEFHDVEEKFRNRNIWIKESGKWVIKDFLIKDWTWR